MALRKDNYGVVKALSGIMVISFLFIACSCSKDSSVNDKKEVPAKTGERIIRIVFDLPGDDIGAPEARKCGPALKKRGGRPDRFR